MISIHSFIFLAASDAASIASLIIKTLTWLAFPVAWMAVWGVTGDLPCGSPPSKQQEEQVQLQNTQPAEDCQI